MEGPVNPHDILRVLGEKELQKYLVNEIQEVYRLQGVNINDKHLEVIARQMMRWVKVEDIADSEFLPEEVVDKFKFREENNRVIEAGGRVCPPTIVGVGVGGTSDLCVHLAKVAASRALGSVCDDPEGAALETALTRAVNMLGVGPQGLGGDSTAFAVHVETAATHITMNPVAVNIQCHSARRASATFTLKGVEIGF